MKKREREREREERGNTKRFPARKCWRVENKAWNAFSHSFFLFKEKHFFLLWSLCRKECINRGLCRKRCIGLFFSSVANKTFRLRQHSSLHWCCREVFLFPPSKFSFQFRYFLENVQSIPANATYSRIPVRISGPYSFSQKLESLNIIIAAHAEVTLHFLRSRLLGSTAISDHYMQVQP